MARHYSDASSSFIFEGAAESEEMGFETTPGAYFEAQQQQYISHGQPAYGNQNASALPFGYSMNYPTMGLQNLSHSSHQRHQSASAQSNHSSVQRSSDGSVFSLWQARSSVGSANTTWSQFSDFAPEHYNAQAERFPDAQSPIESLPPPYEALSPLPAKRAHQQKPAQESEPFLTCISRPKRSQHSAKESRYWCTACGKGFREKYDWKRHEMAYQERFESFECDNCSNIYFLDKDFIHHHRKSHRCQVCLSKRHVELARRKRVARTGWGCGFCVHFSTNWAERCNHIAEHFEKDRRTMENWKHSRVIWSLLQRPEILQAWCQILESKQRTQNPFSWKQSITGRSEGYPDTHAQPQLQDLLEFYTFPQDATSIARLAFETGLRVRELPSAPPPVPAKDPYPPHLAQQSPSYSASYSTPDYEQIDAPSYTTFLGTIPEDPVQPTNVVTLDYDMLMNAFSNDYNQPSHY
ncbi:hypothetical protein BU23DRAFT_39393 [Bimuria novae-zelandiae CBS 107.79]|uniref:C2H2-type domain-containing protein n=1 Tax=Bimuria novae-zelandiae CBS 107.79 TaxID=1447943 RepID=A0A6A5UJN2_9PLEO|nr:hypothetical protein BU23DRAFT_39393 [Bimuria novae-zelandiae CBS 107.79]